MSSDCRKDVEETMATLKFMKMAGKIKLKDQPSQHSSPKAEVENLKDEVRFLKNILHMKRFGGGFSELAHSLKALQKENDELRKQIVPKEQFELLLSQNINLKNQLSFLKHSRSHKADSLLEGNGSATAMKKSLVSHNEILTESDHRFKNSLAIQDGPPLHELNQIKDLKLELKPSMSEGKSNKMIINFGPLNRGVTDVSSPKAELDSKRSSNFGPVSLHNDDDDEEEEKETGTANKFSDYGYLKKSNRASSVRHNLSKEDLRTENAVFPPVKQNKMFSYDNFQSHLSSSVSNPIIFSPQRQNNLKLKTFNTNRASPPRNPELMGIMDLIEGHSTKRSEQMKMRQKFSLSPPHQKVNEPMKRLQQPIKFDNHFTSNSSSNNQYRTSEILKKLGMITARKDPHQHKQFSNPQLTITIKPGSEWIRGQQQLLKNNYLIAQKLDQRKVTSPSNSQLLKSSENVHGKRFYVSKYDRSLQEIKKQLAQLNFD